MSVYASTRRDEMEAWGWNPAQQQAFVSMQFEARNRYYASTFSTAMESVILFEDIPIGSMILCGSSAELRLVDISILPEHRNRGFGTELIANLILDSKLRKLPLRLSVLRANRAIQVYKRLGFVITGGDEVYLEMEFAGVNENFSESPSQE
jgi:ribosomal protein S18 acetylase RimI-like enzyme